MMQANRAGDCEPVRRVALPAGAHRARLTMWRRRHLQARAVVAMIALSSLVAPGVAAVVLALV